MTNKTLLQLWKENNNSSKGLSVRSHTNKTSKYKVRFISKSKNLAVLVHRGNGMNFFKIYIDLFTLDNPRWERI